MKTKILVSLESDLVEKLDKWCSSERLNRSSGLEKMIDKFDYAEYNLNQILSHIIYDPKYYGAAKFNKEQMELILKHDSSVKDGQHFINKMIISQANKIMQGIVKQDISSQGLTNVTGLGSVNEAHRKFMEKLSPEKHGIKEYDTEGNPLYE